MIEQQMNTSTRAHPRQRSWPATVLLAVAVPVVVAGCSSAYKPTLEGKPIARVRFITEHPTSTAGIEATFVGYLTQRCNPFNLTDLSGQYYQRVAILAGNASLGTPLFAMQQPADAMVRQGMPGEPPSNDSLYSERRVPAGENFSFGMSSSYRVGLNRVATCSVAGAFTPEVDTDYQAVYLQVGLYGCAVRLSKYAVAGKLLPMPVPVEITELPKCTPNGGQ